MSHSGASIPNPLPADELSPEDRLDEVAALLAAGLLRARARRRKKAANSFVTRENVLEARAESSPHGRETPRNGKRP